MAQLEAVEGLDVSRYQGEIDHARLRRMARYISFAYVRMGEWRPEGTEPVSETYGLMDEQAPRNFDGFRRNGIVAGGYHRTNPAMNTAEKLRVIMAAWQAYSERGSLE